MMKPQRKREKKTKPKIQQLKRKHNQKDAGLKRKPKSPLQYFCAELQAVFLPSPSGLSSMWYSSPSLDLNKKLLCFEQNVMGCLTPSRFSPGSNLKVDYGLSSSSKFIPVTNRSQNVRKRAEREERHARNTTILQSCKQVKSYNHMQSVKIRSHSKIQTVIGFCLHLTE